MRRCVLGILAIAGVAHAGPWTVTVEGGAEADTNVQRVETGPGLPTTPVAAGVLRLGARVDHRGRAFGGSYVAVARALSRLVGSSVATTENVALLTGELRYLRPVEERSLSLGFGALVADAMPLTDDVGARTFGNLGADALLVLRGGESRSLTLGLGARRFTYKENHAFDWTGPVASARLDMMLWQPADETRSLELTAYVAFEAREYASTALANACPPGAPPDDPCSAGTSITRRDSMQRIGAEVTWTGSVVASAGYQLTVIDSNSYGQSLVRHRATVSATRALPLGLYGTALAILQLDQYPDGLLLQTDLQRREFTSLDDENRSSLQLRIARPLSDTWSIESRAAIWRNLGESSETAFRRASLYAGAIYTR